MKQAFILGGTKGLGLALAQEAVYHSIESVITGSSANTMDSAVVPTGTAVVALDLSKPLRNFDFSLFGFYDYFFWNAGIFLPRKPFVEATDADIERMVSVHLLRPLQFIRDFQKMATKPFHFVTIASVSSWRLRADETIYCSLKAAKAAFTRNYAVELTRNLPGSKVTLINPAGIKTPNFWKGTGQDISKFMDPRALASVIWNEVLQQEKSFSEIQIMRDDAGKPWVTYGPMCPEILER